MLAAATTTGDWIVGGVALVIGLAIIVGIVWVLYRLVTWPARRRRRSHSGLGSDYEQMIRQQSRTRPTTGGSNSPYWPPPPGSATPRRQVTAESVYAGRGVPPRQPESRVVLPPPPYRQREADSPEPEPATPAVVAQPPSAPPQPPSAPPSTLERLRVRRVPGWVILTCAWLGLAFVLYLPIALVGGLGWDLYGLALASAVLVGAYTKRRYRSKILWQSRREIVVWQRWGKGDDADEPPVIVTAVGADLAAPVETPGAN